MSGVPARVDWDLSGSAGLNVVPWRDVSANGEGFRTKGSKWEIEESIVFDVLQSPYRVQHDDISTGEPVRVSIIFVHAGTLTILGTGSSTPSDIGVAGWVQERSGLTVLNSQTSRITVISLPASILEDAGVCIEAKSGMFPASSMIASPARSYIRALIASMKSPPNSDATPTRVVADTLNSLAVALFLETQDTASARVQDAGLYTHALALIQRQCTDQHLTPGRLADQLNVSLRHLQRAFRNERQTIRDVIRQHRLRHATAALDKAELSRPGLLRIAGDAGFSSVKQLRHALRTHT